MCVGGFCNAWVCVCVSFVMRGCVCVGFVMCVRARARACVCRGFVMRGCVCVCLCGCFGNMCTSVYCVLYCLYFVTFAVQHNFLDAKNYFLCILKKHKIPNPIFNGSKYIFLI